MAQIAKMQEQMGAAQDELENEFVTESAGGGAVSVTMSGKQVCSAIVIDAGLLEDGDAEMLQDLVLTAVNKALDSSRKLSDDKMVMERLRGRSSTRLRDRCARPGFRKKWLGKHCAKTTSILMS